MKLFSRSSSTSLQLAPGLPPHRHQYGQHSSIKLREARGPGEARYRSRQTEKSGYNRYKFGTFIYSEVPAYRDRTANNRKCICGDGRRDVCEQSETSTGSHLHARPELAAPPSSFPGTRRAHEAGDPATMATRPGRAPLRPRAAPNGAPPQTDRASPPAASCQGRRPVCRPYLLQGSARVCCRRCSTASSSNPVAEPATSRASRCLPRRRAARHRSSHSGRSAR